MGSPTRNVRAMSEAQFQKAIIAEAKDRGWSIAHVEKAQRRPGKWTTPTTAGLPDLILLRPPRLLFLELKRQDGKPTDAQIEWVAGLQAVDDTDAYIVRPSDRADIMALLE